jgi:SAM-dependent methyltransferase
MPLPPDPAQPEQAPREHAPTELSRRLAPPDVARAIAELGSEPRACLLCGGTRCARSFQRDGKWFWRCPDCALVFVHDIYPEFLEDTAGLSTQYAFDRLAEAGPRKSAKYDDFLALLEPWRTVAGAGRMLEIGCGQGLFLAHARAAGWSVQGVEVLEPVALRARERGLEVFLGTLEDARLAPESCDAVVLREVIEHIVEPVALMRAVLRVLRPGGVAALGTGNAESWAARVRGGRWSYYRFGGHMHIRFYSPRSAAALARAAGFARAECRTRGFAFRENGELAGHWYRPLVKLAQAPLSPLAGALGAGQRLVMLFHKGGRA